MLMIVIFKVSPFFPVFGVNTNENFSSCFSDVWKQWRYSYSALASFTLYACGFPSKKSRNPMLSNFPCDTN